MVENIFYSILYWCLLDVFEYFFWMMKALLMYIKYIQQL